MAAGADRPALAQGAQSFFASVNVVFLATVINYAVAFPTSIVVARTLGKAGYGAYTLFFLSAAVLQQVIGLGAGNASIYFLGKRAFTLRQVVTAGQAMVAVAAIVTVALVAIGDPLVGDELRERGVPPWAFLLAVPALMDYRLLSFVLQGAGRFVAMSLISLLDPGVFLIAMLAALAVAGPGASGAIWLRTSALAAAGAVALAVVGLRHVDVRRVLWPERRVLKPMLSFGVQGEVGNLLQTANYRLDAYLVALFVSQAGVGLYAAGVGMAETIWIIANSIAAVLVTGLTAAHPDDAARRTPVVTRNTLLVSAAGAGALAAASPVLVELLYGGAFAGAVVPLLWLLPGAVAMAGSKVVTAYIFSQGRPLTNSMITAAALIVTVFADVTLIPVFGVSGAAMASSLAYGTHFALALWAYRRLSGGSVVEALVPRRSDLQLYADALRSLPGRRRSRQPAEGPA